MDLKEVTWLGCCNWCDTKTLYVESETTDYLENGTFVLCKHCGNQGTTMSYGDEEVVVEWD